MLEYEEYIKSKRWRDFRRRYQSSDMPQACLVCDELDFTLHHLTYKNMGREHLVDVVPLCWRHHRQLHESGVKFARYRPIEGFQKQLVSVFGMSSGKASEVVKPWKRNAVLRLTKKQRKELKKIRKRKLEARKNREFHERMCQR